jgi:hypothetical protein
MSDETKHVNTASHGDYERRDISTASVLYFLAALALGGVVIHFIVTGVFHELEKRSQEQQTSISPLVSNTPMDTRHLPQEYKTDAKSTDYEKYLQKNFPAPQLETDERDQLNQIRLNEENVLSTYGYIDQSTGTVRIPIERAMDLIAQRGLPARGQGASTASASGDNKLANATQKTKGNKP